METVIRFALVLFFTMQIGLNAAEAKKRKAKSKAPAKPVMQKAPGFETSEIKVLLQESSTESFLSWIKTVDSDFEQKHIFFFDTPNLDLDKQGVVLRVRRMQDETYDSTVKLRGDELAELPSVSSKNGKLACEVDTAVGGPTQKACAVTQKSKKILPSVDTNSASAYFNTGQTQFAKFKFPDIKWKELKTFGRIISTQWTTNHEDLYMTFELWTLPSKKRFLESSIRVPVKDAESMQKKLIEFLKSKKFQIVESPQFKTNLVLSELK